MDFVTCRYEYEGSKHMHWPRTLARTSVEIMCSHSRMCFSAAIKLNSTKFKYILCHTDNKNELFGMECFVFVYLLLALRHVYCRGMRGKENRATLVIAQQSYWRIAAHVLKILIGFSKTWNVGSLMFCPQFDEWSTVSTIQNLLDWRSHPIKTIKNWSWLNSSDENNKLHRKRKKKPPNEQH